MAAFIAFLLGVVVGGYAYHIYLKKKGLLDE